MQLQIHRPESYHIPRHFSSISLQIVAYSFLFSKKEKAGRKHGKYAIFTRLEIRILFLLYFKGAFSNLKHSWISS